jgi:hypothetical protein
MLTRAWGYPNPNPGVEQAGGASVGVTVHNLEAFVTAVVDATVGAGVARQAAALREGAAQVVPLTSLRMFTDEELHVLVCGEGESDQWTTDSLLVRSPPCLPASLPLYLLPASSLPPLRPS